MRIRDIATIASCTLPKQDTVWLLNLDAVEQQTGKVIEYKYVSSDMLTGSTTAFDTNIVLYSKLRPNLNKVVVPAMSGYATSEMLPLRPDPQKCTREYLAFYLRSNAFVEWAISKTNGAKMPRLGTKDLLDKEIPLPSIPTQKHIVAVFVCVESLIDELSRMLSHFDDLVKSRFIEMFGDPVRNPKGWPVQKFEDISILITDGEHATPRRTEKGIYLLSARNVLNHALQLDDVDFIDEDEYSRIARRVIPQEGDVLISCSGSIGRCCVVPANLRFQMVRSAALIRFSNAINPIYAEWLITSDELQRQIAQSATQSSQANLFQGKIQKLHGYVPPKALQDDFALFVTQTDKSKVEIQNALNELEILKKSLMQQYFG